MSDRKRVRGRRTRPWVFIGSIACLGGLLAGCGGEGLPAVTTYPVQGKVLLANGKPLTVGQVYFVPTAEPLLTPSGEVGPDGTFSLTTLKPGDGAAPGKYLVRINPRPKDAMSVPKAKLPKVPFKYTDEDASGLVVVVKPEPNQLEPFRLK